jgi:hypothetical protein
MTPKEVTRITLALLLFPGDENEPYQTKAPDTFRTGSAFTREEDCWRKSIQDKRGWTYQGDW